MWDLSTGEKEQRGPGVKSLGLGGSKKRPSYTFRTLILYSGSFKYLRKHLSIQLSRLLLTDGHVHTGSEGAEREKMHKRQGNQA